MILFTRINRDYTSQTLEGKYYTLLTERVFNYNARVLLKVFNSDTNYTIYYVTNNLIYTKLHSMFPLIIVKHHTREAKYCARVK